MLELKLENNRVYYNDTELKINKQASKGPGNEVIDISKCAEANGQKWLSLSKLHEGINKFECKASNRTYSGSYSLTQEEQMEIKQLEQRINEIKENARKRSASAIKLNIHDINNLNDEQKLDAISQLEAYIAQLRK